MTIDSACVVMVDRIGQWPEGCGLTERAVRTMLVVMGFVFAKDSEQVALIPDQGSVEDFPAAATDPAFHDRIRSWGLHWTADRADPGCGEHRVPCGGELRVSITKEELHCLDLVTEVHQ
jgi:hypothetical protein